jgi:predicted CXXCH cytochrome family protein
MKATGSSLTRWVTGLAFGLAISGAALAATGIAATKHNLSSGGTGPNKNPNTDQICVFCHTPHGSDTDAAVPLWNKKLPAAGGYTVYNSVATSATSTIDGTIAANVGSVSLACLSCHDGSQAMDNALNRPGSGLYDPAGALIGGTWTGVGTLANGPSNPTGTGGRIPLIAETGANTKDLTNDHPIGIQYCGGGLTGSGTTVSGSCNDADFVTQTANNPNTHFSNAVVRTKTSGTSQVFWVETGTVDTTRQKTDISLYTRSDLTGPSVECGSCHDPHVESKSSDNIMFMRVTTAGSAICLSCHVK